MTHPEPSELTIIVPTWNQSDLLQRCLTSLQMQTLRPGILVVDNGSKDDTANVISQFPGIQHQRLSSNLGFAKAVNAGLKIVDTPYVALLNNDTEAHPEWAEQGLIGFSLYPDYSFFASKIIQYFDRRYLDSAGDCYPASGLPCKRGWGKPEQLFNASCEVLGACAGAAFYRREMFDQIGFLEEDYFMYLEDVEFSLRARLQGYRCRYLPRAIVYHIEAASDPGRGSLIVSEVQDLQKTRATVDQSKTYYSAARVFWITRNRWSLMITYQPSKHILRLVYGWSKSGLFHLLKGGFFGAFLRGLWSGLCNTPGALNKRRKWKNQCKLTEKQRRHLFHMC